MTSKNQKITATNRNLLKLLATSDHTQQAFKSIKDISHLQVVHLFSE